MDIYYMQVKEFCFWLTQLTYINEENAETLTTKIMKIFIASTELEYPETITQCVQYHKKDTLPITCGEFSLYWEVYDPFNLDEAVCGSLIDDLSDIYNEIQAGICMYECGKNEDAIWQWKWSFENHWKYHATDAIRALSRIG